MSRLWPEVEAAFQRLEAQPGFEPRPVQKQLARFVCERMEGADAGMVEAPTGIGKSLAVLLPAIAYCLHEKKRVVISTYTNVLAEQYWRKDLPLALSLSPNAPSVALAMGRSRYACLDVIRNNSLKRVKPEMVKFLQEWIVNAEEGTETELNQFLRRKAIPHSFTHGIWEAVRTPPACRAKLCPYYRGCFYYKARRQAAEAGIVITNHAFVLTDAIVRASTDNAASLLDDYDMLIVDEARDFLEAAASALEFNLDKPLIESLTTLAAMMSNQIDNALTSENPPMGFLLSIQKLVERFTARCREAFESTSMPEIPQGGVATRVAPADLAHQPALAPAFRADWHRYIVRAVDALCAEVSEFLREVGQTHRDLRSQLNTMQSEAVGEIIQQFNTEFTFVLQNLQRLKEPEEGVCWIEPTETGWKACYEPLLLGNWLREHLWSRQPALLMSATLTVDGQFDFFEQQLGLCTPSQLRLPPVFDYRRQCALYLPPVGVIPEPPRSAQEIGASVYYQRLADEITALIRLTHGRALVLFASRNEMREVHRRIPSLPGIRILIQGDSSNADLSKQFLEDVHSVLFGVRSFWTGFDAPGDTLMNLILTRIPFEVPTTPLQRARQAWFEANGKNAFVEWSLPMAKQQMRQGFGRLIRRSTDTGIVAILDPRMRTKSYGRAILSNLPSGIPIFDSQAALAQWFRQNAQTF